jgi:hypothetical protein
MVPSYVQQLTMTDSYINALCQLWRLHIIISYNSDVAETHLVC